jgi:hypothetical protein
MSQKKDNKFYCRKCDYTSRNKYDFNKHLSTAKHNNGKMVKNGNKNDNKLLNFKCTICAKGYKYRSGLSRHQTKPCKKRIPRVLKKNRKKSQKVAKASPECGDQMSDTLMSLTKTLAQQGALIEKLVNSQNEMIPRLGNNNNNKISINVFLNEHCKEAMNLEDFIDNIKISMEDLEYTNEHGYVKGISNIFTKNLTDMKATQRPIHCSDKKRMQFYIKEKDTWEKDKQNVKINNSIQEITKKQILELKQWEDCHPNYLNNNIQYMEWQKMVQNLMGGGTSRAQVKNTESIKKTISQTVDIKEAIEIKV